MIEICGWVDDWVVYCSVTDSDRSSEYQRPLSDWGGNWVANQLLLLTTTLSSTLTRVTLRRRRQHTIEWVVLSRDQRMILFSCVLMFHMAQFASQISLARRALAATTTAVESTRRRRSLWQGYSSYSGYSVIRAGAMHALIVSIQVGAPASSTSSAKLYIVVWSV